MTTALLAIDWGTTTARVYRLNAAGEVLDQRSGPYGILQVSEGNFPAALATLLGDWANEPVPRLACGMIGSRQGWREAPYVDCPASLDALADGIVTAGDELRIVPGLIARDAHGTPDVLRGEETQLAGAVARDEPRVLAILPGTHSKWAIVEQGTVVDFATFMTGELYSVLLEHSILGRLVEPSTEVGSGFASGVQHGLQGGGLTHDLFAARTLALTGVLAGNEVAAWLSGLLIGREIHDGRTWFEQRTGASLNDTAVRLIGTAALSQRYAEALKIAGHAAQPGPVVAAAHGLWSIARQAGIVT